MTMKGNLAVEVSEGLAGVMASPKGGDIALVGHVEVELAAQVGTVSLSIEKLFSLAAGDVLPMNELLDEPVTLLLNGKAVARAELLAIDDQFGLRIIEIA
jgi:flagellar motor switch protein FliN/FliY